jgi:hypothetical protein
LQNPARLGILRHVTALSPPTLVLLRLPRGSGPPTEERIRQAIAEDRRRLHLPPSDGGAYRLTGPYAIVVDGQAIDEFVAWET